MTLGQQNPVYIFPNVGLGQGVPAQAQLNAPVGADSCFLDTYSRRFVAGEYATQPFRL